MAFEIFVQCDREGCGARQQVPQQGAIPETWIQVRYFKPNLNGRMERQQGMVEPTILTLCGWRCLLKHVKGFVREEVEIAAK